MSNEVIYQYTLLILTRYPNPEIIESLRDIFMGTNLGINQPT